MTAGDLQRQGSLIRQLQGALAGRRIQAGSGSWTFPGATPGSNTTTVTHGLNQVPTAVLVQTSNRFVQADVSAFTTTTFQTTAVEKDNNIVGAGSISFWWFAIADPP